MKKLFVASTLLMGLVTTPSMANPDQTECYNKCNREHCEENKVNWDKCFRYCWPKHSEKIEHCKIAAAEKGYFDKTQKDIVSYFAGAI